MLPRTETRLTHHLNQSHTFPKLQYPGLNTTKHGVFFQPCQGAHVYCPRRFEQHVRYEDLLVLDMTARPDHHLPTSVQGAKQPLYQAYCRSHSIGACFPIGRSQLLWQEVDNTQHGEGWAGRIQRRLSPQPMPRSSLPRCVGQVHSTAPSQAETATQPMYAGKAKHKLHVALGCTWNSGSDVHRFSSVPENSCRRRANRMIRS